MRADEFITEMPQIINNIDPITVQQAEKDCLLSLKNNTCTEIKRLSNSTSLYHYVKSSSDGCYFLATDKNLDYLVNYKKVEFNPIVLPKQFAIRQVLIKRFPGASAFSAGIGMEIFWNYIFSKIDCIVSDSQQTDNGRQFWEYRIKEALEKNLTVRMINTNDNTFVDIRTIDELTKLNPQIYGTSNWFRRIILAIF